MGHEFVRFKLSFVLWQVDGEVNLEWQKTKQKCISSKQVNSYDYYTRFLTKYFDLLNLIN
jgi:hypothetical protein